MTENEPMTGADDDMPETETTETEQADSDTSEASALDAAGSEGDERAEPATPEEVADTAKEFISGLLAAMELEGEVGTSVDGTTAHVDVAGEHLGALIGRRGQTLDALQEVARAAVQRRLRSRVRLAVDVEGYRARRRDSLAEYAREMAGRAKERGTEIELEPMTSYERKVVHDAVAEVDGASSFSEGEEPNRKVVIRGE
ncbi:MAG: spoIIIJ-associated protein [Actinomycetota bacterium]|jgi:spoIIIJ-associated protein|nr:spoIIIJ-associated protein [Actinomycetota bacterium]